MYWFKVSGGARRESREQAYILSTFSIDFLKLLVERTLCLQLQVNLVQPESGQRILDGIVGVSLDILLQHEPSEEAQRQSTLTVLQVVQIDGVNDLFRRHEDVCEGYI